MKYVGSKNRLAKHLLPIILADRKPGQWYVEPFAGGFNMIDKAGGLRMGNDTHYYLIELFRALRDGWKPPGKVTEHFYNSIKHKPSKITNDALYGFIGFCCSYAGKWWVGYARGKNAKGQPRNYAGESRRNLLKQAPKLKDVIITCEDYKKIQIPDHSIVYCDPPYKNTSPDYTHKAGYMGKFDSTEFFTWAIDLVSLGHTVFISEYKAPDDPRIKLIWQKDVNSSLSKNTGSKKAVEKLFKVVV